MEPMYDGRVSLKVKDTVKGTWALPRWDNVSVGRLPSAGLHIPNSWVPTRLCRFIPYERGWLLQLGRARGRVENKYVGDHVFAARSIVALQAGRTRVTFPELDDLCQLGVVIGEGQAAGLPEVLDSPDEEGEEFRTRYAARRLTLPDSQRQVIAVTFLHLLARQPTPSNLALAAAKRLGKSEQAVKNAIVSVRDKVNGERWLHLKTTDQLGHYLVQLSGEITLDDLPPDIRRDVEGLPR